MRQARQVLGGEQQVGAERRLVRADRDGLARRAVARREMPLLVELAIVRQVHFWHHAQQPAAMDRHRAVVEPRAVAQRRADHQHRQQFAGARDQRRAAPVRSLSAPRPTAAGHRSHSRTPTALETPPAPRRPPRRSRPDAGSPPRWRRDRPGCSARCRPRRGRSHAGRANGTCTGYWRQRGDKAITRHHFVAGPW